MSQSYRSDLTDEQWEIIQTLIPAAKTGGRPRTVEIRGVVNGIFYILVAGCAWCMLPHDFPLREDSLSLLPTMAYQWHLGTNSRTVKTSGSELSKIDIRVHRQQF